MAKPKKAWKHKCCLVWFFFDASYRLGCPHCSRIHKTFDAVEGDERRAEQSQEAHTRLCRVGARR